MEPPVALLLHFLSYLILTLPRVHSSIDNTVMGNNITEDKVDLDNGLQIFLTVLTAVIIIVALAGGL